MLTGTAIHLLIQPLSLFWNIAQYVKADYMVVWSVVQLL